MSDFVLARQWREAFMQTVQQHELAARLKTASRQGKRPWTAVTTTTLIHTGTANGGPALSGAANGFLAYVGKQGHGRYHPFYFHQPLGAVDVEISHEGARPPQIQVGGILRYKQKAQPRHISS